MVIITPAIPNKMHSSTQRAAGDGTGGNTAANTAEVKKPKHAEPRRSQRLCISYVETSGSPFLAPTHKTNQNTSSAPHFGFPALTCQSESRHPLELGFLQPLPHPPEGLPAGL